MQMIHRFMPNFTNFCILCPSKMSAPKHLIMTYLLCMHDWYDSQLALKYLKVGEKKIHDYGMDEVGCKGQP